MYQNGVVEPREKEGVIKYELMFTRKAIPSNINIEQLDQWRHVLFNLALIGQDSKRYGGFGFGNISSRVVAELALPPSRFGVSDNPFLISGSQTGHLRYLMREHFALVTECHAKQNYVAAQGACKPSSESMTHGVLYNEFPSIGAVVHVHSPTIWRLSDVLELSATDQSIPYGTIDMADAVVDTAKGILDQAVEPVFVMKGHVDGVVSFGPDLPSAVSALLGVYHKAMMKSVR
ncbi:class II aldolase/adducin family protein [Alkalimarinus coralli]|uniref:class II aldolase/adducin family protein n=1 Tax=Alkalimarinus coralli TaxID=2935863 RepID=UPI00202B720F|nr:class II aldolase/adducin family protein [Alkalimarinus coralli]